MGFIMEPQGSFSIESRRESFYLSYDGEPTQEISYQDVPDLLAALIALIDREHLVTGFSFSEYKAVGPRLEREKELLAVQMRGEYEEEVKG